MIPDVVPDWIDDHYGVLLIVAVLLLTGAAIFGWVVS